MQSYNFFPKNRHISLTLFPPKALIYAKSPHRDILSTTLAIKNPKLLRQNLPVGPKKSPLYPTFAKNRPVRSLAVLVSIGAGANFAS